MDVSGLDFDLFILFVQVHLKKVTKRNHPHKFVFLYDRKVPDIASFILRSTSSNRFA